MGWWQTLTEAQATVISGILTIIAAAVGVFLGSWLFGGKISNLETALDAAKERLDSHSGEIESKLNAIELRISSFEETIYQKFARLEQTNDDREAIVYASDQVTDDYSLEKLKEYWQKVSNYIENVAASVQDGRTRAKYARVDRRQFWRLIERLANDGAISHSELLYEANDLWQQYRNGRKAPTSDAIKRMKDIAAIVVADNE